MSDFIADITNTQNWRQVYWANKEATIKTDSKPGQVQYLPMKNLLVPLILDTPILIINITSYSAKTTWHYAGKITRSFSISPINSEIVLEESKDLNFTTWSNTLATGQNLITFDSSNVNQYNEPYRVTYSPPKWFINYELTIYKYTGSIQHVKDLLNQKIDQVNLDLINQRIDQLNAELTSEIQKNANYVYSAIRNISTNNNNSGQNQGGTSPFGF